MPNVKKLASKCPRTSTQPPEEPHFTHALHKARYEVLKSKPFGTLRNIEWGILRTIGIADQVKELLSQNGWENLFSIDEPTFRQLTFEVLSTFEARQDERSLISQKRGIVRFQAFGKTHKMNHEELAKYLGVYDEDYTSSLPIAQLHIDFPRNTSAKDYWATIAPSDTKNTGKSSRIVDPIQRYVHALITCTIGGRRDSLGCVSQSDLLILFGIFE